MYADGTCQKVKDPRKLLGHVTAFKTARNVVQNVFFTSAGNPRKFHD